MPYAIQRNGSNEFVSSQFIDAVSGLSQRYTVEGPYALWNSQAIAKTCARSDETVVEWPVRTGCTCEPSNRSLRVNEAQEVHCFTCGQPTTLRPNETAMVAGIPVKLKRRQESITAQEVVNHLTSQHSATARDAIKVIEAAIKEICDGRTS